MRSRRVAALIALAAALVPASLGLRALLLRGQPGRAAAASAAELQSAIDAVKAKPSDPALRWRLVEKLKAFDDKDGLALQYSALIDLEPDSPRALLEMAAMLLAAQRYAEAGDAFGQAARRWPDNPEAWSGLSAVYYSAHRYADATRAARRAVALSPAARFKGVLAVALMESTLQFPDRGNYKRELAEARRLFESILDTWDQKGELHYRLGRLCIVQRDNNAAVAHLQQAQTLLPDRAAIPFSLATAYLGQGKRDDATKVVDAALLTFPREAALHDLKGQLLQRSGQPHAIEAAFAEFQSAATLSPKVGQYQERYGVACVRAGKLDDARKAFQRAADLHPNRAFPFQQLALVFNRLGRAEDARKASRIAAEIAHDENLLKQVQGLSNAQPKNVKLLTILAERYRDLGMAGAARDKYERILEIKPGDPTATAGLAALERQVRESP